MERFSARAADGRGGLNLAAIFKVLDRLPRGKCLHGVDGHYTVEDDPLMGRPAPSPYPMPPRALRQLTPPSEASIRLRIAMQARARAQANRNAVDLLDIER